MEEQVIYRVGQEEGRPAARSFSFSAHPRHIELVTEMAARSRHLNKSRVIQEAIEEKAQRELAEREQVPA